MRQRDDERIARGNDGLIGKKRLWRRVLSPKGVQSECQESSYLLYFQSSTQSIKLLFILARLYESDSASIPGIRFETALGVLCDKIDVLAIREHAAS